MNLRDLAKSHIESAIQYGRITFQDGSEVALTPATVLSLSKALLDGKLDLIEGDPVTAVETLPVEFMTVGVTSNPGFFTDPLSTTQGLSDLDVGTHVTNPPNTSQMNLFS